MVDDVFDFDSCARTMFDEGAFWSDVASRDAVFLILGNPWLRWA